LEELITKVDSRYTLVVAAAKRARQIMDAQQKTGEYEPEKPVTRALREISEGTVSYARITPSERLDFGG
jgi:DNA-directed RNA polymerase subunit omega